MNKNYEQVQLMNDMIKMCHKLEDKTAAFHIISHLTNHRNSLLQLKSDLVEVYDLNEWDLLKKTKQKLKNEKNFLVRMKLKKDIKRLEKDLGKNYVKMHFRFLF